MFELYADKVKLSVQRREAVTSGSVNVYRARFGFSRHWDGLEKTAIFQAGDTVVSVLLDENGECAIPWEALSAHGVELLAAVYGARASGEIVLPTAWASLGVILKGAEPGETARPPTPDLWQQELDRKGDALEYDGLNLTLKSGDRPLSEVQITGGGGGEGGGTTDHRILSHRDAESQHPTSAIEGLDEELKKIPAPVEALTNLELEALLK